MLKVEDCKPGVEVICINATPHPSQKVDSSNIEQLKLWHIYTIEELFTSDNRSLNSGIPVIYLAEITTNFVKHGGTGRHNFGLHRFKLINPKDIKIFYDILDKPIVKDKELVKQD